MNKKERNHIVNMNRGMKQKISMLLIACLLFTGYQGMTLPGRAAQEDEQNNAISVSGTEVKVQLLGEDLRRAAKEAIEKGERVNDKVFKGYSKDADLEKEYEAVFSPEKEVYEISLDSISAGLSESLAEEEAGLEVFVERDAQDLDNLVRKESKESLLLYDGNSQISQLFPKSKETAIKKEEAEKKASEELASDSNLPRSTELTGSELITFLYKNKSDHRITFQLSVDSNKYPKVVVSPKEQLFKELLAKLKKEEKNRALESKKNTENKAVESTEVKNTAAKESEESKAATETVATEAQKESTSVKESTSAAQESSSAAASEVRLVSEESKQETKVEAAAAETEEKAQTAAESKETAASETEKETVGQKDAEKRAEEKLGNGFLAEVVAHYDEFLGELQSARFTQYSLNELGRKSQNAEIENFATVEVFYDKDAFDEDVVLEAKRLVKPEEEGQKEGEKLTEEQVKAMKDQAIYDDSDALDIRFVSKDDRTKEVEPKVPVSVRLTFDKEAVPEDTTAEAVEVHHIVEEKNTGKVQRVETLVRAETDKTATPAIGETGSALGNAESNPAKAQGKIQENSKQDEKQADAVSNLSKQDDESGEANKEGITKEFVVRSFSPFVVTWKQCRQEIYELRFHYVDRNFREIAPTVYVRNVKDKALGPNKNEVYYQWGVSESNSKAYKTFPNFGFEYVGGIADSEAKDYGLYNANRYARWQDFHGGAKPTKKIDGREAYYVDDHWFTYIDTDGSNMQTWEQGSDCKYKDFFFIYSVNPATQNKQEKNITPTLSNEKFITDNKNGTYDLTLTGQVKKQQTKQKLDVLFVYDNTAVMATDFGFNEKANKLSTGSYASKSARKSEKVKAELKKFMGKLSNADCDVRYALVTMDGDKGYHGPSIKGKYSDDLAYKNNNDGKIKINQFKLGADPNEKALNIVGDFKGKKGGTPAWLSEAEDDEAKSDGFNITDEAYNDTKHVQGFTANPQDIMSTLNSLDETQSTFTPTVTGATVISGENYASAMKNVKALMGQGDYEGPTSGRINSGSKVRSDAEKIVVFIAGGNPKFATINQDGVYDDTQRDNATDYYMIRRNYTKGWSYGNGYSINFAALNQARGELSQLSNVDAFYSIGVGNSDNWKYLNDFAMGQAYNSDGEHIKVKEPNREGYMDDYWMHPDRREKALADGVQYKCYGATSPASLSDAFRGIYQRVSRNAVQNVEITDILTKYVQPLHQNNSAITGQLVKMKDNGVEVDHVLSEAEQKAMDLEGFEVSATKKYSSEYGRDVWTLTLKTKPADFSLPAGYDIRLVAKVEPTDDAKNFLRTYAVYPNTGEARTDLNDIYKTYLGREYTDPSGKPKDMFNTSAGRKGLFTNEKAEITYKKKNPNGSTETPPGKTYNKPIIHPEKEGYLKINKGFIGINGKMYDASTNTLTDLGKKIIKNIRFEIRQREKDGSGERLLTTINLGDDLWVDGSFQNKRTFRTSDGYDVTVFPFEKDFVDGERQNKKYDRITIQIDNLPLDKKYQILEKFVDEGAIIKADDADTFGYKFAGKDNPSITEDFNDMNEGQGGNTYVFRNKYNQVTNDKTITIRKVVEELGGTAFTQEARNEKFNFYIALYRLNGSTFTPLTDTECNAMALKWKSEYPGDKRIGSYTSALAVPMADGSTINTHLIRVSLKHGESLSLNLDSDLYYKVLELKDEKYEVARAVKKNHGSVPIDVQEVSIGDKKYSITTDIYDKGAEFIFKNPKITLVPTGLRGDFTPYVLSLCGFTFMAGIYLSIKKKKREEV